MGDNFSIIGPGWADNIKLDTLDAALQLNSSVTTSMRGDDTDNFWACPPRFADDAAAEVMEWSFTSERLVNHVKFELARFPHDAVLECFDLDERRWVVMVDDDHDGDQDCARSVLDCVPAVLPPASSVPSGNHPQHAFSGHWDRCEWQTRPRRCQKMRLRLKRHRRAPGPRNALGQLIAYSLAVRNLYCGYRVNSIKAVPRPKQVITSKTEHEEFATSQDLLGSSIRYSIRINRAENILSNATGPGVASTDTSLVWMSEPQPFPWAVVNYYMDVRDANGDAQTLDRFYLDPVTQGPNVNLYYSNDEPSVEFEGADTTLPPNVAVINGTISGPPLSNPATPVGTPCWVDIDNTPICYNPRRKWWMGAHLRWKIKHRRGFDPEDYDRPLYDCGEWTIKWTRHGLRFTTRHGDFCYVDCDDFDPADDWRCFVWHDGDGRVRVRIRCRDRDYDGECRLSVRLDDRLIAKHRCGGSFDDEAECGDFDLRHLCLKVDEDCDDDLIEDFFRRPNDYTVKTEFVHQDTGKTKNALLRYYPGFISEDFPAGFKGGGPTRYDKLTWSPIARDFRLAKGFLQFPPTKAKYWKLEFCDLTPQSYEVYIPIKRTVKTYETRMWNVSVPRRALNSVLPNLLPGYLANLSNVATVNRFGDQAYVTVGSGANVTATGVSNTMARVITDQVAQRVLSSVSWSWNFMPCHRMARVPVFDTECVHTYSEVAVEQTSKLAYFVALRAIQPYRVDYLSVDDTDQYTELFTDEGNLDSSSGWTLTEDHALSSGDAPFAQAQSRIFPSSRVVRALQFTTTQSAPTQLLADDDFDDATHEHWTAVGDGALASTTAETVAVGSTLRVDRSSQINFWETVGQLYPTWADLDSVLLFGALEGSNNPGGAFGGVESVEGHSTPPGGRVYAAARVVAPAALSSPLYVQIVDALTDQVLAESSAVVPANQVVEWHTGYTIGESANVLAWRWSDFSANPRYRSITDSFSRINAATLGSTSSGLLWSQGATGHTINSLTALTASAGAHDYFDGGTAWGSYTVTLGTMAGTGQTYARLLDLQPLTLDDQGVLAFRADSGGGSAAGLPTSSVLNRAAIAGDVIRLDILPTALVPAGKKDTGYTDDVSAPYSVVVYLNGTWVKTIAHRLGAMTRKGILGRLNQRFAAVDWTPAPYGPLPGKVLSLLPLPGVGSFAADGLTFTDTEDTTWAARGSWDNATVSGSLVATTNNAKMIVDTGYWYGTLSTNVRHVATGTTGFATPHGHVLSLDEEHAIYLEADGTVTSSGTLVGTLVPGGVSAGSFLQVSFLDTASVAATIRGAISPTVAPRMLVARVNGAVVGTLGVAEVASWTGTRRGLCGDAYNTNGGSLPGGSIADLHTSFTSFAWAPDASVVVLDPNNPTWAETSMRGTGTYDSISHNLTLHQGQLKARVVQKSPSTDIWDMDALSLYVDPIVWSFSNDGGYNFYNVYDIKNDPNGVFIFPDSQTISPTSNVVTDTTVKAGQALVWRAISYAPHAKISSLTIRPWYGGLLSGITHRVGISNGGPNVMPYDHYPPIEQDARFQVWHDPIPQDWYYAYRVLTRSKDGIAPPIPLTLLAPDALVSKNPPGVS
jgi:hypothetical protein